MVITIIFVLLLIPNVYADDGSGYDINTEVTLQGVVTEAGEAAMGPYVFTMVAADKTYKVMTGPWWYINQIGFTAKTGMTVEVTGSKYYDRKGGLSVAAYSITTGGMKTYRFRDGNSQRPLWHGRGMRR
ncbi:hypothetical protein [Candidatus Magnetominusculus xianensis]|uniref:Magnetosome protein MamS/MamX domain-containing protein n=1 Tax=Candidatus Magnetominusculus xianensis TaxID=1748249 RepID=A0ABR5SHT2_9BACT|nr:hypothetical protein [Candidatus Magnetominusculus xianensis]KWT91787.1 hypothetical protein ASN18_0777 [Candidatus Magnetominusculus xianensis]MBF0404837.1 hypothetical protein [Nitrospirota bacterium]